MNSNLILENGQFLMEKIPASSSSSSRNMQMYVGDGITTLANLQPVGVLPDVLQRMIFIHDNTHGLQIPIVIADEDGNIVFTSTDLKVSVGEIKSFVTETPPDGWLECDGSTLARNDYPDLYDCLDGLSDKGHIIDSNSFMIPDLRGEFLRGRDAARLVGTRQVDALQNISGGVPSYGIGNNVIGNYSVTAQGYGVFSSSANRGESGTMTQTYPAGNPTVVWGRRINIFFDASLVARTDTETRPANIAVMWCIKY